MAMLVADCSRCGAREMTFDVRDDLHFSTDFGWRRWSELFCVCRACFRSTTFIVSLKHYDYRETFPKKGSVVSMDAALNTFFDIQGHVSLRHEAAQSPPEHLPDNLKAVFTEGATCLAVLCWNAAGTMFRLCIDLATRPRLPEGEAPGLNSRVRRDLGLRLRWLFDNNVLPQDLLELSTCVREDGDDGAHAGTLQREDAQDLLDFTNVLLDRLFTEPERLRLAQKRRADRRTVGS